MTLFKRILLSALLLALFVSHAPSAQAIYQVDPMRLMLQVPKDRNVVTGSITITNPGKETVRLKAYTGYWGHDASGGLVFLDQPTPSSIIGTIRFNPREFELKPGGRQVVRLAFPLSPDSPEGEYHSIIYFEDLQTEEQRLQPQDAGNKISAMLTIKQRFAVIAYIFKGDVKPGLALASYECNLEQDKLLSIITLENKGNQHYRGNGSFLLYRLDGTNGESKPVQEIPMENLRDIVVLPGSQIQLKQVLLNAQDLARLEPGNYKLELNLVDKSDHESAPLIQSVNFNWNGQLKTVTAPVNGSPVNAGLNGQGAGVVSGREKGGI
jgi:hypothetical protein